MYIIYTVKPFLKAICICLSNNNLHLKAVFYWTHKLQIRVNLPALTKHMSSATIFWLSHRCLHNIGSTVATKPLTPEFLKWTVPSLNWDTPLLHVGMLVKLLR